MRRLAGAAATAVLLAGPFVLAFFSGGFFDRPRLTAALVAWLLVGVAALVSPVPLPRALPGRLALGSLALLCALTALSLEWGPLAQDVVDDTGRLLLYLGVLVAAVALLRGARARAALEPVLAGGALVVVLYGLSERFLPGVIELARSTTAAGRLEQPLTYWNAMGGMAALGIVLATRVAGDPERSPVLRAAAAAAAVPLGLGVYMSFSRGALLSACLGLLALCVLAPALRAQARACLVAAAAAGLAAGAAAALPATRTLEGGGRTAQGAVLLAAVLLLAAGSAALAARAPAGTRAPPDGAAGTASRSGDRRGDRRDRGGCGCGCGARARPRAGAVRSHERSLCLGGDHTLWLLGRRARRLRRPSSARCRVRRVRRRVAA